MVSIHHNQNSNKQNYLNTETFIQLKQCKRHSGHVIKIIQIKALIQLNKLNGCTKD